MAKETMKVNKVNKVNEKELELWAKWLAGATMDEEDEKRVMRLAKRVVNLGDMSSVTNYLVDVSQADMMHYIGMVIERLSIMEYIVTDKLGVGVEEMAEYSKRYKEELAEAKKAMEAMEAAQAEEPAPESTKEGE